MTVCNPATGETVGAASADTDVTVRAKASALRRVQPEWELLGPRGRKHWLLMYQDWVLDNTEHIIDVVQSETGKTRADASIEPLVAVGLLGYWARHARRFLAGGRRGGTSSPRNIAKRLTTTHRPFPVVGVITPWNNPFMMPALDAVAALAAGAAVLLKPSEVTPLSAVEFARGWAEIGAPPVLELAIGGGDIGAAVIDNSEFVQFTGSTATGRNVAMACADRLIPYSLELGGKDPALVLADADIDRAVNGIIWGGLANSGQICMSVERVYVEAPIYDAFVAKLTDKVEELRQGQDKGTFSFDVGAMTTRAQCDKVQRHVDEAVAAGARAITGGRQTGVGTFFEPTVLVDVQQSMSCMTDETFGPVLPVVKVVDEAEAIRLANDSTYGLSATVWTRDSKRGERVARQLEAGAINVNDAFANSFVFDVPLGGWKQSGIGVRFGGAAGLLKYCRPQVITSPRLPIASAEPLWYPVSRRRVTFTLGVLRALSARGLRRFGFRTGKSRRSGR